MCFAYFVFYFWIRFHDNHCKSEKQNIFHISMCCYQSFTAATRVKLRHYIVSCNCFRLNNFPHSTSALTFNLVQTQFKPRPNLLLLNQVLTLRTLCAAMTQARAYQFFILFILALGEFLEHQLLYLRGCFGYFGQCSQAFCERMISRF